MEDNISSFTLEQLEGVLAKLGQPSYRAKQLYSWIHDHNVRSYDEMTNLPLSLRSVLSEQYPFSAVSIREVQTSEDGSRKYLIDLEDGSCVEAVGIPTFQKEQSSNGLPHSEKQCRLTVCFSTQVGCPLACSFCATGKEGYVRNLTEDEILQQLNLVKNDFDMRIDNIVAMGQGEPFLNYDALLHALYRINNEKGFHIGARHITVSTAGIIQGIKAFALEPQQYRLAVSLHSAQQETRNFLMPQLQHQPLTDLKDALLFYNSSSQRRVTLEYMMIQGVNDSQDQLDALLSFCTTLNCHINLIPFNTIKGFNYISSSEETIDLWMRVIKQAGIPVSLRKSKGSDIAGACGQLKNNTFNL